MLMDVNGRLTFFKAPEKKKYKKKHLEKKVSYIWTWSPPAKGVIVDGLGR
jgi:hypothetical protein